MSVSRFGVSLEEDLLKELDRFVSENKFPNRSQAIRFLIEKNLVEKKWQCNNIVTGAIVLIYDSNKKDITNHLSSIQSEYSQHILSKQLFYLENNINLEIVAIKGPSYKLTELSDKLISCKGIKHGKLVMSKAE